MTRLGWGLAFALASVLQVAAAAPPAVIPAADFVRPSQMGSIRFSPDGTRFAAMIEDERQMKLAVVDYATNKGRRYRSPTGADVASFRWINSDLIDVDTTKRGARQFDLSGRDFVGFSVDVSERSRVTPDQVARTLRGVPGKPDELIVKNFPYVGGYGGVPRLDVIDAHSGETLRQLTGEPPSTGIYRWVLDRDLQPRAAVASVANSSQIEVWWRDTPKAVWRKLTTFRPATERGYYPVAMDASDNLLVVSNLANGRFALQTYDFARGAPGEVLAAHPTSDIETADLRYAADRLDPVGLMVDGDRPQDYWFDAKQQAMQELVDKSLAPDAVNRLQFLPDGRVLVSSYSGRDPGTYYFYDPKARSLTEWARKMPWIDPQRMAPTRVQHFKARDGLDLPAYVTVPLGREAKSLPLVVWVHGGPHLRDTWGFDPEVQFFANRGYAVLQVNFRGSTGYGDRFMTAGYRQWGRAMQDDLTDSVRALVADGTVDAQRVCIGGASYGGYAALMGPIREPDLYRCAIDQYGPSDLTWMVELPEADYNRGTNAERDRRLHQQIGDPDDPAQRREMDGHSPRLQAARLKAPVLLIYGTDDYRVPLRHGTAMRSALEASGGTFEWKSYAGEGHGVRVETSTAEMLTMMEKFLERHIGANRADSASR
jgi:dipeptidyl aminopeptidase/acylaminoacyl peptidase